MEPINLKKSASECYNKYFTAYDYKNYEPKQSAFPNIPKNVDLIINFSATKQIEYL